MICQKNFALKQATKKPGKKKRSEEKNSYLYNNGKEEEVYEAKIFLWLLRENFLQEFEEPIGIQLRFDSRNRQRIELQ